MRQAEGVASGIEWVYVPTVLDNDKDPTPVRVKIRTPNNAQKRGFQRGISATVSVDETTGKPMRDDDGNPIMRLDMGKTEWTREALEQCVISVENYNDAGGKPITTGLDLWTHGEDPFVTDVAAEIVSGYSLSVSEKKTPNEPSASISPKTTASDGPAKSAEPMASISGAGVAPVGSPPTQLSQGSGHSSTDARKHG